MLNEEWIFLLTLIDYIKLPGQDCSVKPGSKKRNLSFLSLAVNAAKQYSC